MRTLRMFLFLTALTAIGAVSVALALGATPTSPVATTSPATGMTDTGVTLHGTVNPEGQQTDYAFQWGPTTGYGHETALASAGDGSTASSVGATLASLSPGSTNHFRVIAMNASGTSVGSDQTFATTGTAPAPSTPPAASTGAASSVGQASVTLNGTINPSGQATTYYFEFGTTTNYGIETAPVSAGAGTSNVAAIGGLRGLTASTTYHFRLVAVSAGGTALGADQTVQTTTPPAVSTGGASLVGAYSAVFNATVNPEKQATAYYFQFGTTTAYGLQSRPVSVGSGSESVAVHHAVTGLVANTTYHYRVVAESPGGASYGGDRTMKTTGPAQIPSRVRVLGRMGFVSRGGWIGVVIGCFGGQTHCSGHFALTQGKTVIGQRNFSLSSASGGFQNVRLSSRAQNVFGKSYHGPALVELTLVSSTGQRISQALHLARWR